MVIGFWRTKEKYGCFSNWYKADIIVDNKKFNCCEQYMMYYKALLFNDTNTANQILKATSPTKIKALGRKVNNFDSLIWANCKEAIVYKAVLAKFKQHAELKEILLSTENNIIVEASPSDNVWGIGMEDCSEIQNSNNWRGKNLLGKIIMQVREELR